MYSRLSSGDIMIDLTFVFLIHSSDEGRECFSQVMICHTCYTDEQWYSRLSRISKHKQDSRSATSYKIWNESIPISAR